MNTGDRVTGTYFGEPFTGIIENIRPEYSLKLAAEVVTVRTDAPIKTPSDKRSTILITHGGGIGITKNTTVNQNG